MNTITGTFATVGSRQHNTPRYRTSNTNWGFTITETPNGWADPTSFAEVVLKIVGVAMIPASGIMLFVPAIVKATAVPAVQYAMILACALIGFALYRYANRGFIRQVRVDTGRREIQVGTCNAAGRFHETASYSSSQIESFFIVRSKDRSVPAKLQLRLNSGSRAICLATGNEKTLVPLLENITLAILQPKLRNRRVTTKAAGGFIRVNLD